MIVGLLVFLVSNLPLILAIDEVLALVGVDEAWTDVTRGAFLVVRLSLSLARAVTAYRAHRSVSALFPSPEGTRWYLDYIAAVPARKGHGGRALTQYLQLADAQQAEVALHCPTDLVPFYRRYGFRHVTVDAATGQRLMLRPATPATITIPDSTVVDWSES